MLLVASLAGEQALAAPVQLAQLLAARKMGSLAHLSSGLPACNPILDLPTEAMRWAADLHLQEDYREGVQCLRPASLVWTQAASSKLPMLRMVRTHSLGQRIPSH